MFVNCRVFRWFGAGWRARLQILWISNEKLQEASGWRARVTHLDKKLADEAKFGRNIFLNQRTGLIWGPPTTMRGDMEWKSIFKVQNFAPRAMSIFSCPSSSIPTYGSISPGRGKRPKCGIFKIFLQLCCDQMVWFFSTFLNCSEEILSVRF